jgi:outer membrane protein assembly factor BamD
LNSKAVLSIFLLALIWISACSTKSQIRPGDTLEVAFDKSMALYERERYREAANAFEVVISIGRGTDIGQDAQFYLAQSYYKNRDYLIAASEFQRYSNFYPRSERKQDSDFMEAMSYYNLSPRYNLDQTDTYNAIERFQLYISRFPNSDRATQAAAMIDEMRTKLARKSFEAAEQYMRLRYYQAAAIYYGLTIERFPETKWAENSLANQITAYVVYADNSVRARQAERYQKAIEAYESYIQLFPRGENRSKAEAYYDRAVAGLRASQTASGDGN